MKLQHEELRLTNTRKILKTEIITNITKILRRILEDFQ